MPHRAAPPASARNRAGSQDEVRCCLREVRSRKGRCALARLVIARSTCDEAIQFWSQVLDCFASLAMTAWLSRIRRHMRLDDLVRIPHRLAALDLVDVFHARGDLAPHRVLVVEEGSIIEADEELAVAGIRTGRARHRRGATHMRLLVELGLQLLARAPGAGALRASGLRHETID